jgi:hypothetical protein
MFQIWLPQPGKSNLFSARTAGSRAGKQIDNNNSPVHPACPCRCLSNHNITDARQDRAAIDERLKRGEIRPAFSSIDGDLDRRVDLRNTAAMLNYGSPGWRALGQAVLVYLAIAKSAATAQDSQPGRGTFAEMVAFARLGSVDRRGIFHASWWRWSPRSSILK